MVTKHNDLEGSARPLGGPGGTGAGVSAFGVHTPFACAHLTVFRGHMDTPTESVACQEKSTPPAVCLL